MFNRKIIETVASEYDSFYLYDESVIVERTGKLKESFPEVEFLYSMKCNSNSLVTECVFRQGLGADAASAGEVKDACNKGLAKEQIYYSAPGKTIKDIRETIDKAVLIVDSIDEIKRIDQVAKELDIKVKIGARINPDFSFDGGAGLSAKYGIDEDQFVSFLHEFDSNNIEFNGLHVHIRSQALEQDALERYYKNVLTAAEKIQKTCGFKLDYLNMGSGIGIPYSEEENEIDVKALGKYATKQLADFKEKYPETQIMIETGRYAVGKCGIYVTKILDRKVSHGKTYLIAKNTLNGFIRPSMIKMVEHYTNGEAAPSWEPMFTHNEAFQFATLKDDAPYEEVTIVGNLCTATDVIADDIMMPHLECGDVIIINNAGAYAAVITPMQFSLQEKPAEKFIALNGEIIGA